MKDERKEYVKYYDILNIIACIGVIAMHHNSIVHSYSNTRAWKEALIIEVIAYWAVPVFFMLSGAKLLDYRKKYDTFTFLKKRIGKIVIPWIMWCLVWLYYRVMIQHIIEIASIRDLISNLYNGIFNNSVQAIYWFFIPMIMIYFSMPVLSCLVNNRRVLWYIAGMTFLTCSVLPQFCVFLGLTYNTGINFPVGGGFILYVVLGYLLSTEKESPRIRHLLYGLGIASVLLRYIGTIVLSIRDNEKNTTIGWGYLYFPSVFLAVAVFLFLKTGIIN